MHYTALVHKDPDSEYGVSFPDFPGCIAVGPSIGEAMNSAMQALSFHVHGMVADGEIIPEPRPTDQILSDPDFAEDLEGATLVLIPLVRDLGSTTRINVSLDLGLLEAIDAAARQRKQTRSAFIASAVRKELTA